MTGRRTYIIAEAGVNHDGVVTDALKLIDAAADAGADCVKFQTFDAAALATAHAEKAAYQKVTTGLVESQQTMLRRLTLPRDAYAGLMARAEVRKIDFLSTPFDRASLRFLLDDLGMKQIKVGSGDLNNAPLLLEIARGGANVFLSTGMATLDEVEEALGVLAFGYASDDRPASRTAFAAAFADPAKRSGLRGRVSLLHCTTEYPAPVNSVNLAAMDTLRGRFGLDVGYSDHTEGDEVTIAAVARGATILEKHLTLDRTRQGPDHAASLDPSAFERLVRSVRAVEAALGDGAKVPQSAEIPNRSIVRKSLVAARAIAVGEEFSAENLICKRPGHGLAPIHYWEMLGKHALRAFDADELIEQ